MTPTHPAPGLAEVIADRVRLRICELPDRTSPDDWPEALLVTSDELGDIVRDESRRAVAAWLARPETVERMVEAFVLERTTQDGIRAAIAAVVGEAGNG